MRYVLGFLCSFVLALTVAAGELSIHVLRVGSAGQGLAIFIEGPDGTRVMIDAGNNGDGLGVVRPYLQSLGVTDFDYAIATHYHTDHIGGMDELFQQGYLPDFAAYDRGDANRPTNSSVTSYVAAAGAVRTTATVGTVLPLGDGAVLEIVAANGTTSGGVTNLTGGETQYENAASVASLVRYRDFEFYVGGDLTAGGNGTPDLESAMAATIGQIEVVVASHHGSFTSSSSAVVNAFQPSLVLYSAGFDNPYGHPDSRIVERWSTPLATRVQWCTSAGDTVGAFEAQGFTEVGEHVVIRTNGERFTASGADPGEELYFTTHENPGPIPTVAGVSGPTSLAVTELLIDPTQASDSFGEWFELTNVSTQPVDLFGTRFISGGNSFTLASRILLRQGESIVLGDDGKRYRNGNLFVHTGPSAGMFDFANGSGTLAVQNQNGQSVESVQWGGANLPVVAGRSVSRLAADAPGTPTNFALSTNAWAAGADSGSPGALDPNDTTAWTAGLFSPDPYVGGTSEFFLSSLQDPGSIYFLGLSLGVTLPATIFGQTWFLAADPFFFAQLSNPDLLGVLDAGGRHELGIDLPDVPSLAGTTIFAQFMVLELAPTLVGLRSSNFDALTIRQ